MKKWIATIAIIILSWSGSITAVELSEKGCREMRSAELKALKRIGDLEKINIIILTGIKQYCEQLETVMEVIGFEENDETWHDWLGTLLYGIDYLYPYK